jgi:NADPH-dependent glutamate synthase beta subunit-like oxidoreductase
MPAHRDEVVIAKKEGVKFIFLTAPTSIVPADKFGGVRIECVHMTMAEAMDQSGRQTPVPIPGSECTISADLAISAIGEQADLSGVLSPDQHFETEHDVCDDKVLCIGDALYGPRSVSEAIASGKKAAQEILRRASGVSSTTAPKRDVVGANEIKFYYLNERRKDPRIAHERKLTREEFHGFAETTKTISQKMAVEEAARCINCGTCIACDRCVNFCPDYAITKGADGKYSIDLDYCKGCGLCAEVCERSAIRYGEGESDDQV